MSDSSPLRRIHRFGAYQCDPVAGELHKNGIKVKISDQPLRLLAILLDRPGEMFTRQELGEHLWPSGTFVGFEDSLNTAVNKLRAALNDDPENPRFLETIPRRGYRFIAPVETESSPGLRAPALAASLPAEKLAIDSAPDSPGATALQPLSVTGRFRRLALPLAAAVALCVATGYAWMRFHQRSASASEMSIRSIAVLPFDNFSGDPSQDYFADGMTDELITDLAQVGSLRVISRSSVMAYKNAHKSIREIGRELGADAVIEGSVVRSQGNVRVDAQLIETSDDRHLWAQSFTQDEKDILGLQDDVAEAISERVEVALDPSVRARLANARPVNADAYEAYLHGTSYLAHHTDADLLKSLDYFKQAAAIDPTLAVAYAGMAQSYCYLGDYSVLPDRVVWPQAEMNAQRAIDLDDSIGKAHAALAFALWRYEWNWKEADAQFQKALALNPNDADTHHLYAIFLATKADFPAAARQINKARQLDPLSLIVRTNVGWLSYYQRDYATAIADYQSVLQADPEFAPALQKLWIAYALQGNQQQAGTEIENVFRIFHHASLADRISDQARLAGPAERFHAELLSYVNSGFLTKYEKARLLAVAGEKDAALASLEDAKSAHETWLVYMGIEPAFAPIHSSTHFQHLLAAVGPGPQ